MSKLKNPQKCCTQRDVAYLHLSVFILFSLALSACTPSFPSVKELTSAQNLSKREIKSGSFVLTSWYRQENAALPITIYIEGDGRAYITRRQASQNPTPVRPIALEMALQDPAPNVAYLARPCQYTPAYMNPTCKNKKWWTTHRFDATSITAMNNAVTQLKRTPQQPVILVGFSGGATHALLIASRRSDVQAVITVAGNVAPHLLNKHHKVTPTPEALSPLNATGTLAKIPQLHLLGEADNIVTGAGLSAYIKALPRENCVHTTVIPHNTHLEGWKKTWPKILKMPLPTCTQ